MNIKSPFNSFSSEETNEIKNCLCTASKHFDKKEIIMNAQTTAHNSDIGIVDSGIVYLTRTDFDGRQSIIDYFEQGDVFSHHPASAPDLCSYFFQAKNSCDVTFLNYEKLLSKCESNCCKHAALLNNIVFLSVKKTQMHIDVLSRRSIKSKLMTFFIYLKNQYGSDDFKLPLSLTELADYLSVDRSAMMREIGKMNNDGIIESKGIHIALKNTEYGF